MISHRSWNKFVFKYGVPSSILIGALLIAVSIYVSFGWPNRNTNLISNTGVVTPPAAASVSANDDAFLGKTDAPVIVIEFSDFQCPFCRKLWSETLPQIKTNYIDTGKVKFVYRDFPLPIHAGAQKAAESAECAEDQGQFWDMHDKIFEEQDKQGSGTIQFGVKELKQWAREIGLDSTKFDNCLDSDTYKAEVGKDLSDGQAAGVTGTPGTFVNGRQIKGAQPFEAFKSLIEEELAE